MHKGACLCGAVSFEVSGELRPAIACHCSQCRRQSGHYWVSTDVPLAELTLRGEEHLTWYQSSPRARRGFCSRCGAALFWAPEGQERMAVAMGAFDLPTNGRIKVHIYVADKGDYYEITDGLPQNAQ